MNAEQMREAVARALWQRDEAFNPPWDDAPHMHQGYLDMADLAIAAMWPMFRERAAKTVEGLVQYRGRTAIAAAIRALTMESNND